MRYYIADCHFYHEAVNRVMDKRGFSDVERMNEYMIGAWNAKVRKQDEVVILGDFSWGTVEQTNWLLQQLNGQLYLIEGNHDRYLKDKNFNRERFVWIKSYAEIHDNRRKVVLCHYPIMCYNGQYRVDEKGNAKGYMLHGHVHDSQDQRLLQQFCEITKKQVVNGIDGSERRIPCNLINCFCGYSDYTPLTLDEWIRCTEKRVKM